MVERRSTPFRIHSNCGHIPDTVAEDNDGIDVNLSIGECANQITISQSYLLESSLLGRLERHVPFAGLVCCRLQDVLQYLGTFHGLACPPDTQERVMLCAA